MLHYMPQTWTSDDTDAVERLCIQYGTSFVYPPSSMGAHVSACPNHQTGRSTSFKMRGDVALGGNFGFELDLSRQKSEDIEQFRRMVEDVKRLRITLQQGTFTRIENPFEGNFAAWQFTSADEKDIILCCYQRLAMPNQPAKRVFLRDLCGDAQYVEQESGKSFCGAALMHTGLPLPRPWGDYNSWIFEFKRA
jgi:alpha-galactosidase